MMMTCAAISSEAQAQALHVARRAAQTAAAILRRHAASPPVPAYKSDGSPVTAADHEASTAILACLSQAFPGDLVVSEEHLQAANGPATGRVWIVDPLDGTRDFIAGSTEYAVHVALCVGGRPCLAVVGHPAENTLYEAVAGQGAVVVRNGVREPIRVSTRTRLGELRVGVSRFARNEPLDRLLLETALGAGAVTMGASLKFLAIACGQLDATFTLGPTAHVWDSCAPGLVVTEAGGQITDVDGLPLEYRDPRATHKRGLVVSNSGCHAELCALGARYWCAR